MYRRALRIGSAVLVTLLLLSLALPAFAAGTSQQGAQNQGQCISSTNLPARFTAQGAQAQNQRGSFTGIGNWNTLCGQPAAFSFRYNGGTDAVEIEMATDPADAATFSVYSQDEFNRLGSSDTEALGQSTPNPDLGDRQFWQGSGLSGQRFFVVVRPTRAQNAAFSIKLTGAGSNFAFEPGLGQAPAPTLRLAQAEATTPDMAQVPQTLPVTGASELPILIGAGWALLTGGWLLRRRTK